MSQLNKAQITIKQYSILPFIYKWVIFFYAIAYGWTSISQMIVHSRIAVFSLVKLCGLLALAFFGFTTCYQIDFDPVRKTFRRYVYFAGLKFGKIYHYHIIEKIFINSEKYLERYEQMYYYNNKKNIFIAFLKFDNGEKITLLQTTEKKSMIAKLISYNKHLKTSIYDNTSGTAILIE
jgi:hypothetical protein